MELRKAGINLHVTEDGLEGLKKYSNQLKSQSEQLNNLTCEINQTIDRINQIKIRFNLNRNHDR